VLGRAFLQQPSCLPPTAARHRVDYLQYVHPLAAVLRAAVCAVQCSAVEADDVHTVVHSGYR
jgi:hypothetical protein